MNWFNYSELFQLFPANIGEADERMYVWYEQKWHKVTPDMLMNEVEKKIHAVSEVCEDLDSDVQRDLLSLMDQVLNELSVHVQQLWNPTTKEAGEARAFDSCILFDIAIVSFSCFQKLLLVS